MPFLLKNSKRGQNTAATLYIKTFSGLHITGPIDQQMRHLAHGPAISMNYVIPLIVDRTELRLKDKCRR
jgi:hypothetical protein